MERAKLRHIISRVGVAFIFLTFGIWEIVQPTYWTAFLPQFVSAAADPARTVVVHGAMLVALGASILLGFYINITAILGTLMMLSIVASLWMVSGFTDLLVRDTVITLFALTLALDDTRYLELSDALKRMFGKKS